LTHPFPQAHDARIHSKSVVSIEEPQVLEDKTGIQINAAKYVMVPINARTRRVEVEKGCSFSGIFPKPFRK